MFITPNWPTPASTSVKAYCSTRFDNQGQDFNLAEHVHDEAKNVRNNRRCLHAQLKLPSPPLWLQQTHSAHAIHSDEWYTGIQADACFTEKKRTVCAVLTADCLPILLYHPSALCIAVIHAGWRGLLNGIIEKTLQKLGHEKLNNSQWLVWFGPSIQAPAFEVGADVHHAFCAQNNVYQHAFSPTPKHTQHWQMDMVTLAKIQLCALGLEKFYGGDLCSFNDSVGNNEKRFFSHRRESQNNQDPNTYITGRMASLIWME